MPPPATEKTSLPAAASDHEPGRVAMVIQRFRPLFTGQGVQVEQLCRHLADRGIPSTVLTAVRGRPGEVEDCDGYRVARLRCDVPGVPLTARHNSLWMPAFALQVFVTLFRLRRELAAIHVHGPTDGLLGARLLGQLAGIPVIQEMTLLGDDDPASVRGRRQRFSNLRWRAYSECDAFVAMSEALARAYREAGLPEERLELIPQGVDTDRFRPPVSQEERRSLRRGLGLSATDPVVVFVGSLVHRKGIDLLLEAWPRIRAGIGDAHLLLLGPDRFPTHSEAAVRLERAIRGLPPADRDAVQRLGVREDVHRILRASDCFVFPSRREGFGSVIIEAMATALPCVVAELPGITDRVFAAPAAGPSVEPDCDGIVVERESVDALVAATTFLLQNPEVGRRIGERARRRVLRTFDFERVTQRYVELYRRVQQRS